MKSLRVTCTIFAGLAILLMGTLNAQSAHSRLTDQALLKRFDNLSRKLMCTCGCSMPLRNCNHTGHCNAWPARDALDKLLAAGMSDEQILQGFRKGFGSATESNQAFAMAKSPEYSYMFAQFKDGFGTTIMSIPESNYLAVFTLFGVILCAGVVALFIRSRKKKRPDTLELLDDKHREALLKKISKDEN